MKLTVKVKTNARVDEVKVVDGVYMVQVRAVPVEGKANEAVEKLIAKHMKVAPSMVRVVSGHTAKTKIVEVLE